MKMCRSALLVLLLALGCSVSYIVRVSRASATTRARLSQTISVRVSGGNPRVNLGEGRDVLTAYSGPLELAEALQNNSAQPLSLAAADFDEDGVPDLICGYEHSDSGIITMLRGNVDSIYPNSAEAQARRTRGEFTDAPFLSPARVFALPIKPEFIGTGDFDADGHWDVVGASRSSSALYLLPGDGKGNFGAVRQTVLPGTVTALVTGEINRRDGLEDLVVAVNGEDGAKALVFEGPEGALRGEPEVFDLPAEATALALGQLDDEYTMDLVVAAGRELMVVHGRDRKLSLSEAKRAKVRKAELSRRAFPSFIRSVAAGQFTDENRAGLSVLLEDGRVEMLSVAGGAITTTATIDVSDAAGLAAANQLMRARVSSSASDDLVVIDASRQMHILSIAKQVAREEMIVSASLESEGEPVAMLTMRLNEDALTDFVVMDSGGSSPAVSITLAQTVFPVTENSDTGPGSLRQAIIDANNNPGADTINFAIQASQEKVIVLQSPLPEVTEAVTIDATTQPGYAGSPVVAIRRGGLGSTLRISGGNSTVRGLDICSLLNGLPPGPPDKDGIRESLADIEIVSGGGDKIEGNSLSQVGIIVRSSENIIGGTAPEAGNRFAANRSTLGVLLLTGQGAANNQIQGNFFAGNSQTCLVRPGASVCGAGVIISDASNNVVGGTLPGARNVVSTPDLFSNIFISGQSATGNLVQGNFIGVDETGASARGGSDGVGVFEARNITIGGTTPQARNVISGCFQGIGVGSDGRSDTGILIQGNFIGTDATGTQPVGNSLGVGIFFAKGTTVGGDIPATRNIISGNRDGGVAIGSGGAGPIFCVQFMGGPAPGGADFEVVGNNIGTDVSGTHPLGNGGSGVSVSGNAFSHEIRGNRIAFNSGNGVSVSDGRPAIGMFPAELPAFSIRVIENSIFSNGRLAIDLGNDGVTPNDLRDRDGGANLKQNFPQLTSAVFTTNPTINALVPGAIGSVSIEGNFNSTPKQTFTIESFSDTPDGGSSPPSGSCPPQAKSFLGSTTVTTDRFGNAPIRVVFPVSNPIGFVNATATSIDGNTSELSACVPTGVPAGPTLSSITVQSELIARGFGFKTPVQVFIDGMPFSEPAKLRRGTKLTQRGRVLQPDGKTKSIEEAVPPGKLVRIKFRNWDGGETEVPFRN
ncbi:MAG TPA: VCBS repeat-containing protein [Blastocatellia bacterium]|nr:VCBS repeat-containing protein [Blastocatellia bacterium]